MGVISRVGEMNNRVETISALYQAFPTRPCFAESSQRESCGGQVVLVKIPKKKVRVPSRIR